METELLVGNVLTFVEEDLSLVT